MKQRILFLLCVLFAAISASAYDFAVENADGVTIYYEIDGSKASVTWGDSKYSGEVVIPKEVTHEGVTYAVTSIGDTAFKSCSGLTSVAIPNSVIKIGRSAFNNCTGLPEVTIPESTTFIDEKAFLDCIMFTSVTIPESVTSIGDGAFGGCMNMQAFYGKYATSDNRCLIIDGKLNSFAPSGLTTYTIPESVTAIGGWSLYFSKLTSINIPDTVTSIGDWAFALCNGLTTLTIPSSVTYLGDSILYRSSNLTSLMVHYDNPQTICADNSFFYAPTSTCTLYVPAGTKDLYETYSPWKFFSHIEEYDSGIDSVLMDCNTDQSANCYDLNGRRVQNPEHGIYILNGNKVMVR